MPAADLAARAAGAPPGYPLRLEHVTKRYGRSTVVDDLTFEVRPGRVTGFLGPNGAGKSTTIKILLGLATPTRGVATIGGRPYRDLPSPGSTVGAIVESDAFHPGRSGRDHLRILADAAGVSDGRVEEMLHLVGLHGAADRRAGAYSLGMRQRLGLAGALLCDPPVLVLDEPGNGLDPQGIRDLRDLLRARAALGHTVFVSSHLLGEVEHLADDVVIVNRGRLVTSGPLAELQQRASLVRCAEPARLRPVLEDAGGIVQAPGGDTLVVRGLTTDEIGQHAFHAGLPLRELSPQAGSLEELFLGWTNDAEPAPVAQEVGS